MATQGMAFNALLRRLRLAAGLTQERLAERAGVSAKAIIGLENKPARAPRLETVTRLADALGLDRDDRARLLAAARPASALSVAAGPGENGEPVLIDRPTVSPHAPEGQAGPAPSDRPAGPTRAPGGQDWGEAPDVGALHGRSLESGPFHQRRPVARTSRAASAGRAA
jgi:transcriptional regulator with XRE-family HTH domain